MCIRDSLIPLRPRYWLAHLELIPTWPVYRLGSLGLIRYFCGNLGAKGLKHWREPAKVIHCNSSFLDPSSDHDRMDIELPLYPFSHAVHRYWRPPDVDDPSKFQHELGCQKTSLYATRKMMLDDHFDCFNTRKTEIRLRWHVHTQPFYTGQRVSRHCNLRTEGFCWSKVSTKSFSS